MAQARSVSAEGINHFAGWPEYQFWTWFAGYFDGEGCIYLPPDEDSVVLSVSSVNRDVIESIRHYLNVGHIEEVTHDQPGWNTKYTWRCAQSREVVRVLIGMRQWLTIKSPQADRAWSRLGRIERRLMAKQQRRADALRLVQSGLSKTEAAKQVGLCRETVSATVAEWRADGVTPEDIENDRRPTRRPPTDERVRNYRVRYLKQKAVVTTKSQRLI